MRPDGTGLKMIWDLGLLNRDWVTHTPTGTVHEENVVVVPERMINLDHRKTDRLVAAMFNKYSLILPLIEPGSRVLDACAGAGFGASFLAGSGHDVTAMDANLQWAKLREGGNEIKCAEMDLFDFKDDEGFDAITMVDAIEHFKGSHQIPALRHLYSLLKPGGWFLIDTPNVQVSGRMCLEHPSCLSWADFLERFEKMGEWSEYQRYLITWEHAKKVRSKKGEVEAMGHRGFSIIHRMDINKVPAYEQNQDQVILGRKPLE